MEDAELQTPPPTASFPRGRVQFPENSIAVADTASVAPQHVPSTRVTYPPMTKKSKNAAAAAAEPPAKKSKNVAAVAGGGGDAHRGASSLKLLVQTKYWASAEGWGTGCHRPQ
eukprot:COSAG02_NODE_2609_length_8435_cov_4.723129_1_plen_113_part_00